MIIPHQANIEQWNRYKVYEKAETLIIGSFNPHNPNGYNADYYYGRSSNYFWRAIAEICNLNQDFFLNNLQHKLDCMARYKFCFLDVIDQIELTSENNDELIIGQFRNQKIFTEFSDQILFTNKHFFMDNFIKVSRSYNYNIIELIGQGRINKIIHTMGNNRISQNFQTKPKEAALDGQGFQGFINQIVNSPNIHFVPISYSPSGRAVKVGGLNYWNELKSWLNGNLNINA